MKQEIKNNLITYCVFLIIAAAGIFYGQSIFDQHKFLRVWEFTNLFILLVGIPFLFLQSKAGLPDFWQEAISNRSRILIPLTMGIVFGILDVVVIKVMMHPEPYQELPPFLQPFPYSFFLYFSGAVEIEVFYRLIPLTLLLLFGKWLNSGKYYETICWVGITLTALREPMEQLPDGTWLFVIYSLGSGFLMNFLQALWFRKAGFLASLAVRLGHYLIWHILMGIYVEYFELTS